MKLSDLVQCTCGKLISKNVIAKHLASGYHQRLMRRRTTSNGEPLFPYTIKSNDDNPPIETHRKLFIYKQAKEDIS